MGRKKLEIDAIEVVRMHDEEGKTYKEIAKYYTNKGISVSIPTIGIYYKEGCKLLGKEPQDGRENRQIPGEEKSKVPLEEVITMYEEGKTYKEIAIYYTNRGIPISNTTIATYYKEGCKLLGKEPQNRRGKKDVLAEGKATSKELKRVEREIDKDRIKQIIIKGQTIQEWMHGKQSVTTSIEALQKEAQKLKIVAERRGKRKDGTYISDEDFLQILKWVLQENTKVGIIDCAKIQKEIRNKTNLDVIQIRHFKNREVTFFYLLSRLSKAGVIHITGSYDKEVYQQYTERLSGTVEDYLQKVEEIEERRKKQIMLPQEDGPIPKGDEK